MNRIIYRAACACFMLAALAAFAAAQTERGGVSSAPPAQETQAVRPTARTTIDEDFQLNIVERRITESDFEASTSIEMGDEQARGLRLGIGVAVGANRIDVLLRNVQGRVRFRATLEPLLRRIRRAEPVAATTTGTR
ncbi:MAG TPA: hypothetical protein VM934_03890 [Pyrinomonadaceae bacterium]|nr:hypothetical protein [Pyrinomonadaceae bacterium]